MTDAASSQIDAPTPMTAHGPPDLEPEGDPPAESAGGTPLGASVAGGGHPDATTQEGTVDPPHVSEFRLALVAAVTVDLPQQHPLVTLREIESPRRQLSFSIGFAEGVALSHAVRRMTTPRPLTHELVTGILQGFDIDVVAVRLVGRQGGVYFAELDLRGRAGRSVHSCRPSDALTIASLQPVPPPILIDRRLFEIEGDVAPAVHGGGST